MGQFHEMGVFTGNVGTLAFSGRVSDSPQTGLRFLEHHGLITKFTLGLLAAMATSGDRVETGRTVETVGNIRTTTVYSRSKTDAEREADRQMVEGAINGEYVTEFILYTDGIFGAGSGRAERIRGGDFYLGGNWAGPFVGAYPSVFDAAFVYSYNHASDVLFDDGHRANIDFVNVGVMLRYQLPLTSFFELLVQADVNVYGLLAKKEATRGHGTPLRLGAYVNLTDRFYARPMISYTTGTSGLGKLVEVGVRF